MAATKGQPAAPKQATEHESEFLKAQAGLITETAKAFAANATCTPEECMKIRESWKKALETGHDWTAIKNRFGLAIINFAGFNGRLFEAIYDAHLAKQMGKYAEAMKEVSKLVGIRVDQFSPFQAEELVEAFYAKFASNQNSVLPGDLMGAFRQIESVSNPAVQILEYWIESSVRRRENRAGRAAKTQSAIEKAMGEEALGEPEPEPRMELETAIAAAEADEIKAVAEKRYGDAGKASEYLIELRKQLEKLTAATEPDPTQAAPTPPPTPVATAPAKAPPEPEPAAPAPVISAHKPNGAPETPTTIIAPLATAGIDGFLDSMRASKLSLKVKDTLIARFASGDESGASKAFATLSAALK